MNPHPPVTNKLQGIGLASAFGIVAIVFFGGRWTAAAAVGANPVWWAVRGSWCWRATTLFSPPPKSRFTEWVKASLESRQIFILESSGLAGRSDCCCRGQWRAGLARDAGANWRPMMLPALLLMRTAAGNSGLLWLFIPHRIKRVAKGILGMEGMEGRRGDGRENLWQEANGQFGCKPWNLCFKGFSGFIGCIFRNRHRHHL